MSTLNYIGTGDYYVPNLTIRNEKRAIGKYGYIYCEYLKQQHPIQYSQLVLNGLLWSKLTSINEQAANRLNTLLLQLKAAANVTERLKADNPIAWTKQMNSIHHQAEELILNEIFCW